MSGDAAIAGRIELLKDADALSARAAQLIADRIRERTRPFRLALSGGNTPKGCYRLLGHLHQVPWEDVEIYQGDERFVSPDDPKSNYRMIRETLLKGGTVHPRAIFAIPTDGTPQQAAAAYEDVLRQQYGASRLAPALPLFDLQLLGLGVDGHTASLIPGQPVLEERDRWVAQVPQGREHPRITLTYPALESSRLTLFLVAGEEKRRALAQARAGDPSIPAGRLRPKGDVVWLVTQSAGG